MPHQLSPEEQLQNLRNVLIYLGEDPTDLSPRDPIVEPPISLDGIPGELRGLMERSGEEEYTGLDRFKIFSPKARERVYGQLRNLPETLKGIAGGISSLAQEAGERFTEDPVGSLSAAAYATPGVAWGLGKELVSAPVRSFAGLASDPRRTIEEEGLMPFVDVASAVPMLGAGANVARSMRLAGKARKVMGMPTPPATAGAALKIGPQWLARQAAEKKYRSRLAERTSERQAVASRQLPEPRPKTETVADAYRMMYRRDAEAQLRKATEAELLAQKHLDRYIEGPRRRVRELEEQGLALGEGLSRDNVLRGLSPDLRKGKGGLEVSEEVAKMSGATPEDVLASRLLDQLIARSPRTDNIRKAIEVISNADDPAKVMIAALKAGLDTRRPVTAPTWDEAAARLGKETKDYKDELLKDLGDVDTYPSDFAATPKTGKEALADIFLPSSMHMLDYMNNFGIIKKFLADPEKTIPGFAKIMRPATDMKNRRHAKLIAQMGAIVKGLSRKDKQRVAQEAAGILDGKYNQGLGHNAVINNKAPLPPGFHPKSLELAQFQRKHYDRFFDELKAKVDMKEWSPETGSYEFVFQDNVRDAIRKMNKEEDYLPHLQEFMHASLRQINRQGESILMPPDMIRASGARTFMPFLENRTRDIALVNADALLAFPVYANAALRKLHIDPALKRLDGLTGRMRNKIEEFKKISKTRALTRDETKRLGSLHNASDVTDGMKRYISGNPNPHWLEVAMDRGINSALAGPLKFLTKPILFGGGVQAPMNKASARISIALASQMYRGVLGGNISAAVNNLTQTVNTMAYAGVMPTMKGIGRMLTKEGRQQARDAGLSNEWMRVFERGVARSDKFIFAPFEAAETFNRGVAFHAAQGTALKRLSKEGIEGSGARLRAIYEGIHASHTTQFLYDELARNPFFRSPLGRQAGILTSFPIKQTQFLTQDLTGPQLVKYFALTGIASLITEEAMRVQMGAFRRTEIPGTDIELPGIEFLTQIQLLEGAGLPIAETPGVQLITSSIKFLQSSLSGNPEEMLIGASDFMDSLGNLLPAGVQIRETMEAVASGVEGKRRERRPGVPYLKEGINIGRAFGMDGGRTSDYVMPTDPKSELLRSFGMTPIEQAEEQAISRAAGRHSREAAARKARINEEVERLQSGGRWKEARQLMAEHRISPRSTIASRRAGRETAIERRIASMGAAERAVFFAQNPGARELWLRRRGETWGRREGWKYRGTMAPGSE